MYYIYILYYYILVPVLSWHEAGHLLSFAQGPQGCLLAFLDQLGWWFNAKAQGWGASQALQSWGSPKLYWQFLGASTATPGCALGLGVIMELELATYSGMHPNSCTISLAPGLSKLQREELRLRVGKRLVQGTPVIPHFSCKPRLEVSARPKRFNSDCACLCLWPCVVHEGTRKEYGGKKKVKKKKDEAREIVQQEECLSCMWLTLVPSSASPQDPLSPLGIISGQR